MEALADGARESALYGRVFWTEHGQKAGKTALWSKTQEMRLSEEEKKKFRAAVEPVYEKYRKEYAGDIEKIQKPAGTG